MKAHRTDRVSLGFGLLFLAVAGWWLASRLLDLPLPAVGWFLAVGHDLMVAGRWSHRPQAPTLSPP